MRTNTLMCMLSSLGLYDEYPQYSAWYMYDWCCEYEEKMYELYGAVYEETNEDI